MARFRTGAHARWKIIPDWYDDANAQLVCPLGSVVLAHDSATGYAERRVMITTGWVDSIDPIDRMNGVGALDFGVASGGGGYAECEKESVSSRVPG